MWWIGGGGGGGGVAAMGSFSSSFIASMLYIHFSCRDAHSGEWRV